MSLAVSHVRRSSSAVILVPSTGCCVVRPEDRGPATARGGSRAAPRRRRRPARHVIKAAESRARSAVSTGALGARGAIASRLLSRLLRAIGGGDFTVGAFLLADRLPWHSVVFFVVGRFAARSVPSSAIAGGIAR